MRALLAAILMAAAAWGAYWIVGARSTEAAVAGWLDDRRAEGWVAEAGEIAVRGFPNRFDVTLEDLELADPETGLAWRAPFLQILTLSYRPSHAIVVWPERQVVATPQETLTLTSEDMRASIVFENLDELVLDRSTLTLEGITIASSAGWEAALPTGQLALRRSPETERDYDLSVRAEDLILPQTLVRALAAGEIAGRRVGLMRLEAQARFDRVWDRRAIEERRPQPRYLALREARIEWGELDLRVAGALDVARGGAASGEITVKATNWREMLRIAVASGAVPEDLAGVAEAGLRTLAGMSGDERTLDAPLTLREGRVTLAGLIPLGRLPELRIR